jgi:hypothetical protein
MLPTITEDKYYPRKTMKYVIERAPDRLGSELIEDSADELRGILEDPDSQSPDLGPPPVSRFENEDPIAFNPNPSSEEQTDETAEDNEPVLSANLETRRKRRESGPNIRRVSIFESPPEESEDRPSKGVRAGAKRKFNVQEDEEKARSQPESFRFTRKNTQSTDDAVSAKDTRSQLSERPILGSKPVNTDPIVSPKKQRSSAADKSDAKPLASSKPRGRPRLTITRKDAPELPALPMPEPVPVTEISLEHLPPKTPAVEDIFSPPSTESSTTRPEARDTPPPGNLSSSDQVSRPSRRARPQVSYKEPSLNTKMRRPGKELVDAVQSSSDRRTSVEPTIKAEPNEMGSAWKSLPPAPARGQDEGPEAGSPLREKLVRKDGGQGADAQPEAPKLNSSAASDAISALISATSTVKRRAPTAESMVDTTKFTSTKSSTANSEEKDSLAVFDFTESSPNDPPMSRPRVNLAKTARSSRRHSSVPASAVTEERMLEPRTKTERSLPSLHQRTGSGVGVKSSSTTNLASSTNIPKTTLKDRKTGTLPTTNSNIDLTASVDASSMGNLRAERAASRRKSMML